MIRGINYWRRNILNESDCAKIIEKANASSTSLPSSGNGGLWVQPWVA